WKKMIRCFCIELTNLPKKPMLDSIENLENYILSTLFRLLVFSSTCNCFGIHLQVDENTSNLNRLNYILSTRFRLLVFSSTCNWNRIYLQVDENTSIMNRVNYILSTLFRLLVFSSTCKWIPKQLPADFCMML